MFCPSKHTVPPLVFIGDAPLTASTTTCSNSIALAAKEQTCCVAFATEDSHETWNSATAPMAGGMLHSTALP